MFDQIHNSRLAGVFAALLLFVAGISTAVADQLSLAYVDAQGDAQTLSVDANSPAADLALAAALLGEDGVAVTHDPNSGTGTLADIGAAMATAAPTFAISIAQYLADLSPGDTDAIVAAIIALPFVNANAVLAAVQFGPSSSTSGPQSIVTGSAGVDFGFGIDGNPSRN